MQRLVLVLALAAFGISAGQAEPYYRGKTLTLIVGNDVGGGYDIYARIVARFLPQHVPGNPGVVVENKPGAGGLVAANWIATQAAHDGTVILTTFPDVFFSPHFDPALLAPIASAEKGNVACLIGPPGKHKLGSSGFEKVIELRSTITIGASSAGGTTYNHARMVQSLTGAQFKIVAGYKGSNDILLAIERGEVDGICSFISSLRSQRPQWFDKKESTVLLQTGDDLDGVPRIDQYIDAKKRPEWRYFAAQYEISRPYVVSAKVSKDVVGILRLAFDELFADPKFQGEIARVGLPLSPVNGERMEKLLTETSVIPPHVISSAREMIK